MARTWHYRKFLFYARGNLRAHLIEGTRNFDIAGFDIADLFFLWLTIFLS